MSSLKTIASRFNPKETIGRRHNSFLDEDDYYSFENSFWIDQNCKLALAKAYRRLEGKTQVFYSPETPHARTRMTHTMEVRSLASAITRNLGLNHYLAEAIALGHDIGHVPFGHLGERFLSEKLGESFRHNAFAIIVAELIERDGFGLNLCYETLEGIYRHSGSLDEFNYNYPQEYFAVRIADKLAYIFSDYNDAQRMGYVKNVNKPNPIEKIGNTQRERVKNVLKSVFKESKERGFLSFEKSDTVKRFKEAYRWMFENVYAKADKRIDTLVLEKGFQYIKNNMLFSKCDPVIVFGLLTEKEVNLFANLLEQDTYNPKEVEDTGIVEVISFANNIEVDDYHSFCFLKEDFSN
ncbi:MAG: HD domain-containing protein [Patescibacteria group bacterium]